MPGGLSKETHTITALDMGTWISSPTVVEDILWERGDNRPLISYSHLQTQPEEQKIRGSYAC